MGPPRSRTVPLAVGAGVALVLLLGLALVLAAGAWSDPALGAEPSPGPVMVDPVDTRSDGEGPGIVGSPLEILAGVIVLGVLAAGATLLWGRLVRDR